MGAICACVFYLASPASQAVPLQNGDIISFTTVAGSQASGTFGGGSFDAASLDSLNGLVIGTAQPSIPGIDQTWTSVDFGAMGNHRTSSAVTVIDGTTLDFSGWIMRIGGSSGDDYAFGATQGLATYNYDGTNITLNYHWDAATNNGGNGLGFLGVTEYDLTLVGTVSSVPIPATVWLFGSGLLGMLGMAKRKRAN
jgi:hypothetical protein